MTVTIYHNPRCSKSRAALALLRDANQDVDIVEYLKTPLNHAQIERLLQLLGMEPRDIMRKNEKAYKENHLDDAALSRADLIDAMVKFPILIERPIVVKGKRAVLGRPPESVRELL